MEQELGTALLLGLLQGVFEWLPVSSEGLVAAVYALAYGRSLGDGVEYALWLHAGTFPAALLALRSPAAAAARSLLARPPAPSPAAVFLLLSAAVSGAVGLPLLALVTGGLDALGGAAAMAFIGAALLVTAAVQLRRPGGGPRPLSAAGWLDALLGGLAQGISVIPGFSRSGLTLAALLGRGFRPADALTLCFLMSVPVSLGAAAYVAFNGQVRLSPESLASLAAAFVAGSLTIRLLLRLAARLNYGYFLLAVGGAMLVSALWQLLG